MRKIILLAMALPIGGFAAMLLAQAATPPKPPMTFFVTSTGSGHGGNLGGLAGADAICRARAAAAGAGNRTWRAYLSTQGPGAVNARDRIGRGPWHSFGGIQIAADLAELHGDTFVLARKGNLVSRRSAVTEKGETISSGDAGSPNSHDILTGSQMDGRAYIDAADHTCRNWTSESDGSAQVGHHDRAGNTSISWNSAHPSQGCSTEALRKTGSDGRLYCFAP